MCVCVYVATSPFWRKQSYGKQLFARFILYIVLGHFDLWLSYLCFFPLFFSSPFLLFLSPLSFSLSLSLSVCLLLLSLSLSLSLFLSLFLLLPSRLFFFLFPSRSYFLVTRDSTLLYLLVARLKAIKDTRKRGESNRCRTRVEESVNESKRNETKRNETKRKEASRAVGNAMERKRDAWTRVQSGVGIGYQHY